MLLDDGGQLEQIAKIEKSQRFEVVADAREQYVNLCCKQDDRIQLERMQVLGQIGVAEGAKDGPGRAVRVPDVSPAKLALRVGEPVGDVQMLDGLAIGQKGSEGVADVDQERLRADM